MATDKKRTLGGMVQARKKEEYVKFWKRDRTREDQQCSYCELSEQTNDNDTVSRKFTLFMATLKIL